MKAKSILLCLMLLPMPATGADLFTEPCARTGIPQELAVAIARQESDLNPWAINVQGEDFSPHSYEEAMSIIHLAHGAGKSYDVGLMQINNQWFPRLGITAEELLNPARNVEIGVQILAGEVKRYGMNWLAVGKYHSPNLERGRQYAWRVYRRLNGGRYGETLFASRKTSQLSSESQPYKSGIWRNRGIKPKGRLVTFGVREKGLSGKQDTESGGSSGPEGTAESER